MEQVFAPWRIEWVEREPAPEEADHECVFCTFATSIEDRPNRVVARNDVGFVLLNNYPYNPGHVMVIPNAHTGDLRALDPAVVFGLGRLAQATLAALETALEPDGFNVGLNLGEHAGGSIREHLHAHVVPRWGGDTNFMPVIAETKVIVEAIGDTYERLHDAFADQEGATVPADGRAVDLSS